MKSHSSPVDTAWFPVKSLMQHILFRPTATSALRALSIAAVLSFHSACSMTPIRDVTSLSPTVQDDTLGYNDAIGDASDAILLSNILRARDLEPLNLSQLSSISGSLSLQGSVGFTIPWGAGLTGAASLVSAGTSQYPQTPQTFPLVGQKSITPGLTASTSPTYTLSPLNTQAFTLSILQPVSSTYVLNRWQAGLPRELLLLLFVKEIDFPDKDNPGQNFRYINDPDDERHLEAFQNLVKVLVQAKAELKSFDVMDPVGPPFSLYASTSTTMPVASPPAPTPTPSKTTTAVDSTTTTTTTTNTTTATTNSTTTVTGQASGTGSTAGSPSNAPSSTIPDIKTNADQTGFGLVTGNSDGQYHVGNVTVSTELPSPGSPYNHPADPAKAVQTFGGQLYRVYAGQVELCVAVDDLPNVQETDPLWLPVSDIRSSLIPGNNDAALADQINIQSAGSSSGGSGGGGAGGAKGSASSGGSSGGSSTQAMTAALQAGRISAMLADDKSQGDEIVLPRQTEAGFQKESANFVHVQWRSVSEIFEYLGAALRYEQRNGTPIALDLVRDLSVRNATEKGLPNLHPIFFEVSKDVTGNLRVRHNGDVYKVRDADIKNVTTNPDYTRHILSMLSTLVNYSAQPTVSSSAPIRLLPIP